MASMPKDHHETSMRTHSAQQLPTLVNAATYGHPGCFARIEDAIAAIRAGKMVIVADDEDRENEGDLTIAAEKITPEAINFMAKYGRGLICLAMTPERLDELEIPLMVANNGSRFETAFCVGIEARERTTTGISAADRAATVLAAIDPATKPADLVRPGHVFPLAREEMPGSCDAPGKQKLLWTWRGWPGFVPPELFARS